MDLFAVLTLDWSWVSLIQCIYLIRQILISQCQLHVSLVYSVSESELQTMVSEVVAQMLRKVCTSEITAEKERIAEEKRKLEEERYVYYILFSFIVFKILIGIKFVSST